MSNEIKATDLRIGNLYNEHGTIREVNAKIIEALAISPVDQIWCKPIPLSPDWLIRAGFEAIDHRIEGRIYKKEWLVFSESLGGLDWRGGHISNVPKFLHQLQNLFFALSGKELEFTANSDV